MKKLIIIIFAMILLFPYAIATESKPSYSSSQLIEQAKLLDGETIQYKGEVIGDILVRGEFAWLSVSDNANAVSVFLPSDLIPSSLILGRYAVRGDILNITGIFHRACSEHGGDMDIHGTSVERIQGGFTFPIQTSTKFITLAGMTSLTAVGGLIYVKKIHVARH